MSRSLLVLMLMGLLAASALAQATTKAEDNEEADAEHHWKHRKHHGGEGPHNKDYPTSNANIIPFNRNVMNRVAEKMQKWPLVAVVVFDVNIAALTAEGFTLQQYIAARTAAAQTAITAVNGHCDIIYYEGSKYLANTSGFTYGQIAAINPCTSQSAYQSFITALGPAVTNFPLPNGGGTVNLNDAIIKSYRFVNAINPSP